MSPCLYDGLCHRSSGRRFLATKMAADSDRFPVRARDNKPSPRDCSVINVAACERLLRTKRCSPAWPLGVVAVASDCRSMCTQGGNQSVPGVMKRPLSPFTVIWRGPHQRRSPYRQRQKKTPLCFEFLPLQNIPHSK